MNEQQPHSMQRLTLRCMSLSMLPFLYAVSISHGIRLKGQCAMHLPHLMQAVGSGGVASASPKARIAFVFFKIGCSRSGTAIPIIGPP